MKVNSFYDGGVIHLKNTQVPSKRVGYREKDGVLVAKVPIGVQEFETGVRAAFSEPDPPWPYKDKLLIVIGITMPKRAYETTDVDNMAKSILDAFVGIIYEDDKQIDGLYVSKSMSSKWEVMMAVKNLKPGSNSWFVEPMWHVLGDAA